MAHRRVGQRDKALECLRRLRESMKQENNFNNAEPKALADEAEALLQGAAPDRKE
jgi:hypothetical protein